MKNKWNYKQGDKVYFIGERMGYTIRACDDRYLICTKPYNFRPNTCIYTIVDLQENIKGMDSYIIGPYDYWSQEDCDNGLKELQDGTMKLSYRHREPINIDHIKNL